MTLLMLGMLALLLAPLASFATIISGQVTDGTAQSAGAVFIELDENSTFTVGDDNFNDPHLRAFNEGQNIVLDTDLDVQTLGGTAPIGGSPGTLAANTIVASHYIVFDPANNGPLWYNSHSITGTVTFDSEILALIWETTDLAGSDHLINNNVTYLNPGLRGLELAPHWNNDMASIIAPSTVSLSLVAGSPGDVLRVLTAFSPGATIPEPATAVLIAIGLITMRLRR